MRSGGAGALTTAPVGRAPRARRASPRRYTGPDLRRARGVPSPGRGGGLPDDDPRGRRPRPRACRARPAALGPLGAPGHVATPKTTCYCCRVILYLHGFASGPSSHKARVLSERFAALGVRLAVPDLTPGDEGFERSSPSSMLAVAEATLAGGEPPHAIVGSSLGGYLAALAASRDPSIERIFLMAPAFRLFERWRARLTEAQLAEWRDRGLETMHFASNRPRRIGWQFFEDASRWPAFPEVRVPTLCVAGTRDDTVPLADVEAFVARTPGARLVAVDDGHDLAASLDRIFAEARDFLAPVAAAGTR